MVVAATGQPPGPKYPLRDGGCCPKCIGRVFHPTVVLSGLIADRYTSSAGVGYDARPRGSPDRVPSAPSRNRPQSCTMPIAGAPIANLRSGGFLDAPKAAVTGLGLALQSTAQIVFLIAIAPLLAIWARVNWRLDRVAQCHRERRRGTETATYRSPQTAAGDGGQKQHVAAAGALGPEIALLRHNRRAPRSI